MIFAARRAAPLEPQTMIVVDRSSQRGCRGTPDYSPV